MGPVPEGVKQHWILRPPLHLLHHVEHPSSGGGEGATWRHWVMVLDTAHTCLERFLSDPGRRRSVGSLTRRFSLCGFPQTPLPAGISFLTRLGRNLPFKASYRPLPLPPNWEHLPLNAEQPNNFGLWGSTWTQIPTPPCKQLPLAGGEEALPQGILRIRRDFRSPGT